MFSFLVLVLISMVEFGVFTVCAVWCCVVVYCFFYVYVYVAGGDVMY